MKTTTFFVVQHRDTGRYWPRFAEQTRPRWLDKLNSACLFATQKAAEKALQGTHFKPDDREHTVVRPVVLSHE